MDVQLKEGPDYKLSFKKFSEDDELKYQDCYAEKIGQWGQIFEVKRNEIVKVRFQDDTCLSLGFDSIK